MGRERAVKVGMFFQIKRLIEETSRQDNKKVADDDDDAYPLNRWQLVQSAMREGWTQIRPIFHAPHLMRITHLFSILFLGMLGYIT